MDKEKLLQELLQAKEENVKLEFKREIRLLQESDGKEFAKDVSALANTKGGHLLFGKEDSRSGGKAVGIAPDTFDLEKMTQIVSARCYPPVAFEGDLIRIRRKFFALLTIPESQQKPHEISGTREVWVRRGRISDRATSREIEQLWKETRSRELTKQKIKKMNCQT